MRNITFKSSSGKRNDIKMVLLSCFAILLTQLLTIGCSSSMQSVTALHDMNSESKLCLCECRLLQEHLMRSYGGSAGLLGNMAAAGSNSAKEGAEVYFVKLRKDMTHIFEDSLNQSRDYQYYPAEKLAGAGDEKSESIETTAKNNGLYACVKAKAGLGYTGLMCGKKLKLVVWWEIIGPAGWTLKLETDAYTTDTYGFMPVRENPELRPVWLELASQSVSQFKIKFRQMMQDAANKPNDKMN
jgi:hypothetical protein